MSKINWRLFYTDEKFLKQKSYELTKKKIPTISRKSSIIPKFVGKIFRVHSGKNFSQLTVLKEMIGHKFGEFTPTRTKFTFKKKKKKK